MGDTSTDGTRLSVLDRDRGRVRVMGRSRSGASLGVVSGTEGTRSSVRGRVRGGVSRVGRVESEAEKKIRGEISFVFTVPRFRINDSLLVKVSLPDRLYNMVDLGEGGKESGGGSLAGNREAEE